MRLLILTIFIISTVSGIAQNLTVITTNQTGTEESTKARLQEVLQEYNINKWLFKDSVRIVDNQIPHSHPIITLNSRPQTDLSLLGTLIHENIHWILLSKERNMNAAIVEIKQKFTTIPDGQNAGSQSSTYLHLLVNYLEFDGISQIANQRAAIAIFERRKYYKWVHKTVIQNIDYFEKLVIKHNLKI